MMRIDNIIRELNTRIERHERVANQAYDIIDDEIHMAKARALKSVITLIESYRTDDDSPANKET